MEEKVSHVSNTIKERMIVFAGIMKRCQKRGWKASIVQEGLLKLRPEHMITSGAYKAFLYDKAFATTLFKDMPAGFHDQEVVLQNYGIEHNYYKVILCTATKFLEEDVELKNYQYHLIRMVSADNDLDYLKQVL
jgi:hypothetical protein